MDAAAPTADANAGTRSPRTATAVLLLAALVAVVYWPALAGEAVYDDRQNFLTNGPLRDGDLWTVCTSPFYRDELGYWRPLASLAMTIGHRAAGLAGVHALALLLHVLAAAAAFRIAAHLLADRRAALATAMLFALHPVHVESVAWASALSHPLGAWCALQALASGLHWRDRRPHSVPWRPAAWFAAALMAQENCLLTAPLLLLGLRVSDGRPRTGPAPRLRTLAGLLIVVVCAWLSMRLLVLERPFGGVDTARCGPLPPISVSALAEMVGRPLTLLAVPHPLLPFQSLHDEPGRDAALRYSWPLATLAIAVAAAWTWRRGSSTLRVALLLLVVPLLLPAACYRSLGEFPLAERYLYVPALGFALALVEVARHHRRLLLLPAAAWALIDLGQVPVWRDPDRLFAHALQHAGTDPRLHVMAGNRALELAAAGAPGAIERARRSHQRALAMLAERGPDVSRRQLAAAHVGMAWCELLAAEPHDRLDADRLAAQFLAALDQDQRLPGGWVGYGVALAIGRRFEAAEAAFRHALELDHRCPEAWFNLGYLQFETGRRAEARHNLRQALRCDPGLLAATDLLQQLQHRDAQAALPPR
ncbi:MAG: tetratricopeptide repeat protein [Planctomycetes bacterium]|jgi:tetratricopeptide (TPR) repeat protein|nr:tetratricopeptide repeat protein [Planctomycetota bacterium]